MPYTYQLAAYVNSFGPLAVLLTVFLFFLSLYLFFGIATYFLTRKVLPWLAIGSVVDDRALRHHQIRLELSRSLVSIFIFSVYGLLKWLGYHAGIISIDWNASSLRIVLELVALLLWNEVHFFCCHRLLHTKWLFKRVHRVHHESVVPTPFSTYSFHWGESMLLGSVLIIPLLIVPLSFEVLILVPVFSLLFNSIGHANYRVVRPQNSLSVTHGDHHRLSRVNFGFSLPFLDRVFESAHSTHGEEE